MTVETIERAEAIEYAKQEIARGEAHEAGRAAAEEAYKEAYGEALAELELDFDLKSIGDEAYKEAYEAKFAEVYEQEFEHQLRLALESQ